MAERIDKDTDTGLVISYTSRDEDEGRIVVHAAQDPVELTLNGLNGVEPETYKS